MIRRWLPAALIGWLATRTAAAQTQVQTLQLATRPGSGPRIVVFLASGKPIDAVLDASFRLDASTIPATITAIGPQGAAAIREAVEMTKPTGPVTAITLAHLPINEPQVIINGLDSERGFEYQISGQQVTLMRPHLPGDTIKVRYRW